MTSRQVFDFYRREAQTDLARLRDFSSRIAPDKREEYIKEYQLHKIDLVKKVPPNSSRYISEAENAWRATAKREEIFNLTVRKEFIQNYVHKATRRDELNENYCANQLTCTDCGSTFCLRTCPKNEQRRQVKIV